jgi:hypothetical protein
MSERKCSEALGAREPRRHRLKLVPHPAQREPSVGGLIAGEHITEDVHNYVRRIGARCLEATNSRNPDYIAKLIADLIGPIPRELLRLLWGQL